MTTVRLASVPPGAVQVDVARTGGDADVSVANGAVLSFDPANWSRPQAVRFAATWDFDTADDDATISVSSPGLPTVPVRVTVLDLGALEAPMFADGFE